jgi:DNA mismatch repair protein MutS2
LSNAISIAQNLGLDKELTQKAKEIIVSSKDPSILVVEKLQETQAKLAHNLEETEILKATSQSLKEEYETSLQAVKKDKKKTVKNIKDKFDRELLSVKAEIKEILDELRREKSEKIARRSYARLAQTEQKFREKLSEYDEKQHYDEVVWSKVKIGDKLILKELNQPVEILSLPDKNNYLMVQMGNIKTKIKTKKLAPYDPIYEKKQNVYKPNSFNNFELRRVNVSNTLDLRGLKVEEALDELENYLDKVSLANLASVTVIHGHGTGALKSAVRDFLSTSPYVAKFRAGEDTEGGDGVSVVDIN